MKKLIALILTLSCILALFVGCNSSEKSDSDDSNGRAKENEFHDLVADTQELLDEYADDIYSCWYDYIYEDEYSSVDAAILAAMIENSSNIEAIEANNEAIKELYKDVRDGDLSTEVKAVMQAYNEYYSFVMEVSGSFNSYSASKESLKKELATALKNLSFEL